MSTLAIHLAVFLGLTIIVVRFNRARPQKTAPITQIADPYDLRALRLTVPVSPPPLDAPPRTASPSGLRIVHLMEPARCLSCRHADIATVVMQGSTADRRMLHCKRLDCDNWQVANVDETPISITKSV